MGMKVVAVVQARTGSSRLPGKVLLPVLGRPVLQRMLERLAATTELDEILVATTRLDADQAIRTLCRSLGVRSISGDPQDLLDRHRQAALATKADAVVKIPSDCPLIDPGVIDLVVRFYRENQARLDYASNLHPATWPDGNDVEVMHVEALEESWREARRPFQREHTTPFIWDQPGRFATANVVWPGGRDLSASHRLTLDYAEDYRLIRAVFEALHREGAAPFSVEEIVAYLERTPEVRALNARHLGSSWMSRHRDELRTLAHAPERKHTNTNTNTNSGSCREVPLG